MQPYDHSKIEPKWQKKWEKAQAGKAKTPSQKKNGGDEQKKFFGLIEFPFPSGDGLHVGHIRSNTAMDIIARKRRREGYNVLYPIGWDAFGLPTENYAIKTGLHPTVVTKRNTDNFRRQLKSLGFSFDWSREVDTSDPKYYRWTQWIFLQLLKKGLAYKQKMFINWCPKDLIGLANEEVIDGKCERCGTAVEKREKEQWMLAITKYADRLDRDLDDVNFLEKIKIQQRNWIGKSEGAEITFKITAGDKKSDSNVSTAESVTVFTTRPDTLFGVTYIVLAPENKLVASLLSHTKNADEIKKYIAEAKIKSEIQRTDAGAEKTGVELRGITATNPANGEQVPVWIADYVLADYGTGAVMAVPAHDSRDFAFAKKYRLPIRQVIAPYFENTTDLIPKKDLPISKRAIVHAIVKHPSQDKYLFISWKDHAWNSLITGGIENNETLAEAGKREILEETGYKNARFIDTSGSSWEIHSYFYAEHKNENRYMVARGAFFQLENEECVEITEDEKKKHDIVWLDAIKARDFLTHINQKYIWDIIQKESAYEGDGKLINSGKFTGRSSQEILKEITEFAGGKWVEKFKLRDWIFSRQRYWGEPIPVIHCEKCGTVPVPEKNLPVKLPKVKNYKPTENGESPLAAITKWVNVKCPTCRGKARRETDTMPNWAGSSWYYLRYADPKNKKAIASPEALKYWTPVDWYNGGMEHTTLHLLYSRFWHKFLFDIGVVPTKEPYVKRTSHGLILAAGGEKMSKSKGNVINPDATVTTVGADSLRLYEMFMGPFDQHIAWDENGIVGTRRFIERVWRLQEKLATATIIATDTTAAGTKDTLIHKTIKKVSEDIEEMRFNTAISTMMIAVNELEKETAVSISHYENLLKLLAPFAPHVTEEIWQTTLKHKTSIHDEAWPSYDPTKIADTISTIIVQVAKCVHHLKQGPPQPKMRYKNKHSSFQKPSSGLAKNR
jgi:leucyl-tRNA synthetase